MKLTYWIAEIKNDSPAYNLRGKTRKAVQAELDGGNHDPSNFEAPRKVTVEYRDGFDLLTECLSEGGAWWE